MGATDASSHSLGTVGEDNTNWYSRFSLIEKKGVKTSAILESSNFSWYVRHQSYITRWLFFTLRDHFSWTLSSLRLPLLYPLKLIKNINNYTQFVTHHMSSYGDFESQMRIGNTVNSGTIDWTDTFTAETWMFRVKAQYPWFPTADRSTLLAQYDEKRGYRTEFWRGEHVLVRLRKLDLSSLAGECVWTSSAR